MARRAVELWRENLIEKVGFEAEDIAELTAITPMRYCCHQLAVMIACGTGKGCLCRDGRLSERECRLRTRIGI